VDTAPILAPSTGEKEFILFPEEVHLEPVEVPAFCASMLSAFRTDLISIDFVITVCDFCAQNLKLS
jgi:hypothetical protein